MKRKLTPFGVQVKKRLIDLNMTQVELAGQVGTTKQYVQKILTGVYQNSRYEEKIRELLGIENISA